MDFVTSLLSGSFFLHSIDLSGYLTFIRSGELETGGVGYTVQQLGKCEKTCSEIICWVLSDIFSVFWYLNESPELNLGDFFTFLQCWVKKVHYSGLWEKSDSSTSHIMFKLFHYHSSGLSPTSVGMMKPGYKTLKVSQCWMCLSRKIEIEMMHENTCAHKQANRLGIDQG